MKKFLVFFLCLVFFITSFISYAEVAQTTTGGTGDAAQAVSSTETTQTEVQEPAVSVTEEEVDKLAAIEGIDESEQQSVAQSIYSVDNIDTANIASMLSNIQNYLTIRDKYYSAVLAKLGVISQTENRELAKRAIVKLQENFNKQTAVDKVINNKIESIIKFIRENSDKLGDAQKSELSTQLKDVMQKYFRERELIIHINNSIRKLRIGLLKDQIEKLKHYAAQLEKGMKFREALAAYESALKENTDDRETMKKIGEMNRKLGKKAPEIFVGGKKVSAPVEPILKNGTTLVPLRAISEALDAQVNWDAATQTVTITKDGKIVELKLGSKEIMINGEPLTINEAANLVAGTTMVPLRAVSEGLEAAVGYDPQSQVVTVEDNFAKPEGTISAEEVVETELVSGADLGKPELDKIVAEKKAEAKAKAEKAKEIREQMKNKKK